MDFASYLLDPDTTASDVYNMIGCHMASFEDDEGNLWLTADKITADEIWIE